MDAYESRTKFPVLKIVFRVPSPKIPCSNVQGISLKVLVFSALLRSTRSYKWVALKNFPVFFPVTREFGLMRPVRQRLRPPPRSLMQKEICRFLASRPDFAGVRATSKPKKSNRGGPKHANEHTFRKGTTVHRPSGAENRLNKQCKEMLATCFESVGGLGRPAAYQCPGAAAWSQFGPCPMRTRSRSRGVDKRDHEALDLKSLVPS